MGVITLESTLFDSTSGWNTPTGGSFTFYTDANSIDGATSITFSATGFSTNACDIQNATSTDWSLYLNEDGTIKSGRDFGIYYYVKDAATLAKISLAGTAIIIALQKDLTNYYKFAIDKELVKIGWNSIRINDFDMVGTMTLADIANIQILTNIINSSQTFASGDICVDFMHMTNSFNDLLIRGSNRKYEKVSIKRKDGSSTWESDWQEIDNNRLLGIGSINRKSGDDITTTSYLTTDNMEISFDNYDGYFNLQTAEKSFWYSSYYLHNSQLKIEMGYEDDDGTIVWAEHPIYSGLIKGDLVEYGFDLTVKFQCLGYLSILDEQTMSTFFFGKNYAGSATSLVYFVLNRFVDEFSGLGLTLKGVSLKAEYLLSEIDIFSKSRFDFLSDVLENSYSNLVVTDDGKIYVDYYGYEQIAGWTDTPSEWGLTSYSGIAANALWKFLETTGNPALDSTGNGHTLNDYAAGMPQTTDTDKSMFAGSRYSYWWSQGINYTGTFGSGNYVDFKNDFTIEFLYAHLWDYSISDEFYRMFFLVYDGYSYIKNGQAHPGHIVFGIGHDKDGTLFVRTNDTTYHYTEIRLGSRQYFNLAIKADYTNSQLTILVNGIPEYVGGLTATSLTQSEILMGGFGRADGNYFDTIRMTNAIVPDADLVVATDQVFGSEVDKSDVAYTFSEDDNLLEMSDYSENNDDVRNYIYYTPENVKFSTTFTYGTPTASETFTVRHRDHGLDTSVNWKTYTHGVNFSNIDELILALNNDADLALLGLVALKKDDDEMIIYADPDQEKMMMFTANNWVGASFRKGINYTSPSPGFYYGYLTPDLVYVSDENSILTYGQKIEEIEGKYAIDNYYSVVNMLSKRLELKKELKPKAKIVVKLWEGQLDLLDKVTVVIKQNYTEQGALDGMRGNNVDGMRWGDIKGGLNWTTKTFIIVGIEHDPENEKTSLDLTTI